MLLLHSSSAFRQAFNEFRDSEPGSSLFGVLQVVIGTSAVVSAFGLVKRARWAAWSVGLCGVATAALIAVQPLYEPMESDVQQSLWLGAAVIGVAAAAVSWFARRLARRDAASRAVADPAFVGSPSGSGPGSARAPASLEHRAPSVRDQSQPDAELPEAKRSSTRELDVQMRDRNAP